MSATSELLFELGTEELPPKALRSLSQALAEGIQQGLTQAQIPHGCLHVYATPRRLAVRIEQTALAQPASQKERRGPAVSAAFDAEGKPTRAAQGFARSCKVKVEDLQKLETDKGTWLVHRWHQTGKETATLLPDIIRQALAKLPIPKRMRWGAGEAEFVRPVHWAVLLLGEQTITTELLGIQSGKHSYGHRFHHPEAIEITTPAAYPTLLQEPGQVIADFTTRREIIREQVQTLAQSLAGTALLEDALLDEVCALVEWPVALSGAFDAQFLTLPKEVLISSMQAHQRYFPLLDKEGQLLPNFVTVCNIDSSDPAQVRAGNERVIHPRLSDAAFFWQQDCRCSLQDRLSDLDNIVFEQKLGSLYARAQRIAALSAYIAEQLGADVQLAERAGLLCKADLPTCMVGEFPDLQGIMGQYYARQEGQPEALASALGQHYQPRFAKDDLPASLLGQIVSLADKLDTLTGIFGINKPPSGDKDPFGLRRAALGVLRILVEGRLPLSLEALLQRALSAHGDHLLTPEPQPILDFMWERLRGYYLEQSYRADVFAAVLACSVSSPLDFDHRLRAVTAFLQRPEAASLAAANKRIRNILKKTTTPPALQAQHLIDPEEKILHQQLERLQQTVQPLFDQGQYQEALAHLAELKEPVDRFFDKVMVMVEEPTLRDNRLALLTAMSALFLRVADLSRIQG